MKTLTLVLTLLLTTVLAQAQQQAPVTPVAPQIPVLPPGIVAEDTSILAPLPLTQIEYAESLKSMSEAKLKLDQKCKHSPETIAMTEIKVTTQDAQTCAGRDKELVVRGSTHGLYVCSQGQIVSAIRVALGENGFGKLKEGDEKVPVGTYWLGYPRKSKYFGIFIPVGYPNYDDLVAGRTGHSIGIHGPKRVLFENPCDARKSLKKDWTAGCMAPGRDQQVLDLANWVLQNWPVKVTITPN